MTNEEINEILAGMGQSAIHEDLQADAPADEGDRQDAEEQPSEPAERTDVSAEGPAPNISAVRGVSGAVYAVPGNASANTFAVTGDGIENASGNTVTVGEGPSTPAGESESSGSEEGSDEEEGGNEISDEDEPESGSSFRIPVENLSDSGMGDDSTARFRGASWFSVMNSLEIGMLGVGGIGSNTAYCLARLSPKSLTVVDPDSIERVNMSGQLYGTRDIGKSKADAMAEFLGFYAPACSVSSFSLRFNESMPVFQVTVCGFDNMQARGEAFRSWKRRTDGSSLFIDGRLNAEEFQIFCMRRDNEKAVNEYSEKYLFDQSAVESQICSFRQTTFASVMIGGMIANLVVSYANNLTSPVIERPLPFLTYYNAQFMYLKTEDI